jgi:hypothetical protein
MIAFMKNIERIAINADLFFNYTLNGTKNKNTQGKSNPILIRTKISAIEVDGEASLDVNHYYWQSYNQINAHIQ